MRHVIQDENVQYLRNGTSSGTIQHFPISLTTPTEIGEQICDD